MSEMATRTTPLPREAQPTVPAFAPAEATTVVVEPIDPAAIVAAAMERLEAAVREQTPTANLDRYTVDPGEDTPGS